MLQTLPEEADVIGEAYRFEKEYPELFTGDQIGQLGVYFSYETRNHTYFGALRNGFALDYSATLNTLFRAGLSPHTVFSFPESANEYPLIILPSVAALSAEETAALEKYTDNGGAVIITGPCPLPEQKAIWSLPFKPTIDKPEDFFSTVANGVWIRMPDWVTKTTLPPCQLPNDWQTIGNRMYYNPHRISDGTIEDSFLQLCRKYAGAMPVDIQEADGYLVTVFRNGDRTIVHLLASEYDTGIDHKLDEMRFHRSRVNYIDRVTPMGIGKPVRISPLVI